MQPYYRRAAIVAAIGAVVIVGAALLPDRLIVRNVSLSMDLGLYLKAPAKAIEAGDIVEFPVPPWAANVAEANCIRGPLLKRVTWVKDGELLVDGDHFPTRSFDSHVYGAVPEGMITGRYVPLWTWTGSTAKAKPECPTVASIGGDK